MFHIKICGIRRPADASAASAAGADAIGLNFFPPSVRYLDPAEAATKALSELAASAGLLRVGVFVNESPESIADVTSRVGLDAIQIHGDETVDFVSRWSAIRELPVIRAIKLPPGALPHEEIAAAAESWIDAGCHLLFDADAGASHGGSGRTIDWDSIRRWAERNPSVPWTLAGGLTPENVAEAIGCSGATSVDTASGVEQPRGVKSTELIRRFAAGARVAFGQSDDPGDAGRDPKRS